MNKTVFIELINKRHENEDSDDPKKESMKKINNDKK